MAAKEMSVFFLFGSSRQKEVMLDRLVQSLGLECGCSPEGSPYEFTAQRVSKDSHFLIDFDANAIDVIQEMCNWERPSESLKHTLGNCRESLTVHYRRVEDIRKCFLEIGETIGQLAEKCVVENGLGCLFRLSEFVSLLVADSSWSWERETFPEVPGVANSEWLD